MLCGAPSPVDYGDGAGMNLLNLRTLGWDGEIAAFTAPGLPGRLPRAVPSATIAGGLSGYFEKYGFRAGTPVAVWSGDNPGSLIGVGAGEPGIAVVSLGTSDTFFAAMRSFHTDPDGYGHVFGDPAGGFMSLICFSNGSLAREAVRKECGLSYEAFDRVTPVPESEHLLLPYFVPESTPLVLEPGAEYGFDWASAPAEERVRALLESQILSMRLHSAWQNEAFRRIRVTGGASKRAAPDHRGRVSVGGRNDCRVEFSRARRRATRRERDRRHSVRHALRPFLCAGLGDAAGPGAESAL